MVWIQEPCGRDRNRRKDSCGCGRGFAGLSSHRATTTAEVKEIEGLTLADYTLAIHASMADGGWPAEFAGQVAEAQAVMAARWPAGAVLERDLDDFSRRILIG